MKNLLKLCSFFNFADEKSSVHHEKKKDTATTASHAGKAKKKVAENRWAGRGEKQTYSHPWLLTSLKGHNGAILDMDFSSNGKYLTSCADGESSFNDLIFRITE